MTKEIKLTIQRLMIVMVALLTSHLFCFGQDEKAKPELLHKVGIGGFYFGNNTYIITASFNCILKKRNELEFPIYYLTNERAYGLIAGASFNWATIKKDKRFNFFISPGIIFNDYWQPKYNGSEETLIHYGYFLMLGFIPGYKISDHFSASFELKIGHGYQWVKNNEIILGGRTYHSATRGWYYQVLGGLKLYYHFK